MARRKLSRQQQSRIRQNQDVQAENAAHSGGRVISHRGGLILVELESGIQVECKIKSNLGNIVCGDRVTIENITEDEHRVIAISARDNLLQRVDGFNQVRIVAANISQLIVCLSVSPEPNLFLLDQYLLSAEQQQIDCSIILNKIDLLQNDNDPFLIHEIYSPLGYKIIETSVKQEAGMDAFRSLLTQQVSVISGVSGVGKSSLTSFLLPNERIKIAEISEANEEGRHTTRSSRLYHLPEGGDLIDTPGIRGFSPFIDQDASLSNGFREIHQTAAECKFHNCQHLNEPKCAVIQAVMNKSIHPSRYQNYLKILDQLRA